MSNPGNVAGGLKATLKNPNVSQEAKESAQEHLNDESYVNEASQRDTNKNEGNVVGGYKATLHNPRVSEEAKEHAAEVLESKGYEVERD